MEHGFDSRRRYKWRTFWGSFFLCPDFDDGLESIFDITVKKDEHGRDVTTYKQTVDMAMAFDYDLLTTHYNINLEVSDIFAQEDEFKDK